MRPGAGRATGARTRGGGSEGARGARISSPAAARTPTWSRTDTFYVTDAQLADSLRRDGVDEATEFKLRVAACERVQEAAILLKASQAVACTGQTLLHRLL